MYVPTPILIKEVLGEEIYALFEKYNRESIEERRNRGITIWISEKKINNYWNKQYYKNG